MCGISGFISKKYSKEDLTKMTDALSHRGPDASGYFYDPHKGIGLGHRRLSILDLSDTANQPMTSHCSRYVMVFNGEVYNFKEISNKLKKSNWKTSSDSEVILEAFVAWGIDFVRHLNGMFAIAIFDKKDDTLFLFRDRVGIKPLFYAYEGQELLFASEIKSIDKLNINKTINHNAIYNYLHLGYVSGNQCIYNEIKKVKPGSYIIYKNKKIIEKYYWKSENSFLKDTFTNLQSSKIKLNSLLKDSIKKRLMSDVPVGTFLSGGTDSSIVTAIAQEVNESTINTFSIGFKDKKYNESKHAKKIAQHIGTNHNEFILSEDDALNELEGIINHFDEPFADSSALPTMLVSKMARKYVKVCLSGDGGDELFMGYGAYKWADRINHPVYKNLRTPISKLLNLSPILKNKRAALVFKSPKRNWKSHIFSQEQYFFSEFEISKILLTENQNTSIDSINIENINTRILSNKEKQAYFDFNNYLIDDLLVKVDRASMYKSLEARVPLLDHNIIAYSMNLSDELKISNGVQKYILKELLYDYIPKSIIERPKWGFSIPLERWLKTELNFYVEKYLNKDIIEHQKILKYSEVKKLVENYLKGKRFLYNRIWNLIILNKFISRIQ